jgi:serine protease Do
MDENVTGNDRFDIADGTAADTVNTDAAVSDVTVDNIDNIETIEAVEVEIIPPKAPESTFTSGNAQEKPPVYYTESYKKTKTRKIGIFHLILVAVISSIFGGGVVFTGLQLLLPALQPAVGSYFGITSQADDSAADNGVYKKVEISKSDTPVTAIAEKVSPSIVGVKITVKSQGSDFFFDPPRSGTGEGSGIIIREDGYILTNNHVVENALSGNSNKLSQGSQIEVVLPNQPDKPYVATIVGRDSDSDIAVIKIDAKGLPAAELGDSDKLQPGELAVAIGSPYGLDYMSSITSGIISGLNRKVQGSDLTFIQTDAAINPGNSGGALCNSQGQVIGINTVKISATDFEGLGFAIPINYAKKISQELIDNKYIKGKPLLGVSIDQRFNEEIAKQYDVPAGLLVYDVTPLSAAYKAGIKNGDIITKFDGVAVKEFSELESQKNKHKAGDKVKIELYRDGKTINVDVVLDEDKNQ